MEVEQIKHVLGRTPFRPFRMRLSNGATYDINEPRDFGATRSLRTIVYFGQHEAVLIDPLHVVELVDRGEKG